MSLTPLRPLYTVSSHKAAVSDDDLLAHRARPVAQLLDLLDHGEAESHVGQLPEHHVFACKRSKDVTCRAADISGAGCTSLLHACKCSRCTSVHWRFMSCNQSNIGLNGQQTQGAVRCRAVHALWYGALCCTVLQCSAVCVYAVQCSVLKCSTVRCGEVKYVEVQYGEVRYGRLQYSEVQYDEVQYGALYSLAPPPQLTI